MDFKALKCYKIKKKWFNPEGKKIREAF